MLFLTCPTSAEDEFFDFEPGKAGYIQEFENEI